MITFWITNRFVIMRNTFSKKESMTEKKLIEKLFSEGRSINNFPISIKYLYFRDPNFLRNRIIISVSKNKIKSAVKRNLIKRRIRESYRINKNIIKNFKLLIAFIYNVDKVLEYSIIEDNIIKIFHDLKKMND